MSDPVARRALAAAVLAALAAEAPVVPDRAAERATQQQADDDAHEAALAAVDATTRRLLARIRAMSDAELQALDAATLAAILESVTPVEDASLEAWRAQTDADLADAPAQLQALQTEIDRLLRATEARLDRTSADEEETEEDRMEAAVARQRTPLDQAQGLTADRLTVLRRYIYSFLRLNWVGYAAPAKITAVDLPGQLATVALQDGSGLTVDGVEYGSGVPVVGAPTVLYLGVRAPADAREPTVRPVPAGRAWITGPLSGLTLIWHGGGWVYAMPWPPTDPDAAVLSLFDPTPWNNEHARQVRRFIGADGKGTCYFDGRVILTEYFNAQHDRVIATRHQGCIWAWDIDPDTRRYQSEPRQIDIPTLTTTVNPSNIALPYPPFGSTVSGETFAQAVDPTSAVGKFIGYRSYAGFYVPFNSLPSLAQQTDVSFMAGAKFNDEPSGPHAGPNLYPVTGNELIVSEDEGASWQALYGQIQAPFYLTMSATDHTMPFGNTFNFQTPHYASACWTDEAGALQGFVGAYNTRQKPITAQFIDERMALRWMDGRLDILSPGTFPRRGTLCGGGPSGDRGESTRVFVAWSALGELSRANRPFGWDQGLMEGWRIVDPVPNGVQPLGIAIEQRGTIVAFDPALQNILAIDNGGVCHYTLDGGASWQVSPYQDFGLASAGDPIRGYVEPVSRRGVIIDHLDAVSAED